MHHIFCQNKNKAQQRLNKIYDKLESNPSSLFKLLDDDLIKCKNCLKEYLSLDIDKNIEKRRILFEFTPEKIYDWHLLFDTEIFKAYCEHKTSIEAFKGFKGIVFLIRDKVKRNEIWNKVSLDGYDITEIDIDLFKDTKLIKNISFFKGLNLLIKAFPDKFGSDFYPVILQAFETSLDDQNEELEIIVESFQAFISLSVNYNPEIEHLKRYYLYFLNQDKIDLVIENKKMFSCFNYVKDVFDSISSFSRTSIKFLIEYLEDCDFDQFYERRTLKNLIENLNILDLNFSNTPPDKISKLFSKTPPDKISKLFLKIVLCIVKNKDNINSDILDLIQLRNSNKKRDLSYPLLFLKIFMNIEISMTQFSIKNSKVCILLSIITKILVDEKYCNSSVLNELILEMSLFSKFLSNFLNIGILISKYIRTDVKNAVLFVSVFGNNYKILENLCNNLIFTNESLKDFLIILHKTSDKLIYILKDKAIMKFRDDEVIAEITSYIRNGDKQTSTKEPDKMLCLDDLERIIKKPKVLVKMHKNEIEGSSNFVSIKKKVTNNQDEYQNIKTISIQDKLKHLKDLMAKNKANNPIKEAIFIDSGNLMANNTTKEAIFIDSGNEETGEKNTCMANSNDVNQTPKTTNSSNTVTQTNIKNNISLNIPGNIKSNTLLPADDVIVLKSNTLASQIALNSTKLFNSANNLRTDTTRKDDTIDFYEECLNPLNIKMEKCKDQVISDFNSYEEYYKFFNNLRLEENASNTKERIFEHSKLYTCQVYDFDRFLRIKAVDFRMEINDLVLFSKTKGNYKTYNLKNIKPELNETIFLGIVHSVSNGYFANDLKYSNLVEFRVSSLLKSISKDSQLFFRQIANITSSSREFMGLKLIKTCRILKHILRPSFGMNLHSKEIIWDDKALSYRPNNKPEIPIPPSNNRQFKNILELKNLIKEAHKLNISQADAVARSFYSKDKLFLIQGPPGTGKTTTILSILSAFLFISNDSQNIQLFDTFNISLKILICAPSNTAIDVFVSRLANGVKNFKGLNVPINFLRVGVGYSPQIAKFSLDHIVSNSSSTNKNFFKNEILRNASVVCTTLNSSGCDALSDMSFDLVIIDEACQATEISTIIPFKFNPRKVIMIGDPKQLPPTVISSNKNLEKSLFERLILFHNPVLLEIQYRMHPRICELSSRFFYNNLIKTDPEVEVKRLRGLTSLNNTPFHPLAFIDVFDGCETQDQSKSYINIKEQQACLALGTRLRAVYGNLCKICILTPYKAQAQSLKDIFLAFPELCIEANTIDSFQGKECDFVILTTVREKHLGFTCDFRRINVAITRSKYGLFIVGNAICLSKSTIWKKIIDHISANGRLVKVNRLSKYLKTL